ncbi:MAG: hypothetical protein H6R18_2631 [Proteobacteria bacterium]|nr:hypothetical protein [Pseudomonadota bacterium]
MLVRFTSSQTGEIIMFANTARILLSAIGKPCSAEGAVTRDEMLPAAANLRRAIEAEMVRMEAVAKEGSIDKPAKDEVEDSDVEADKSESEIPDQVVSLAQQAWPLIDMLERSALGDEKANIVWSAPVDF